MLSSLEGVFRVREFSATSLIYFVATLFFLQAARMFTVRASTGGFSFWKIRDRLYCMIDI